MAAYADLNRNAWYHDAVHYVLEQGLMIGTGSGIFEPDRSLSRAMLATILWRVEGSPAADAPLLFTDVAENAWYAEAVRWAANTGAARAQAAAMLMRFIQWTES